MVPLVLEVGVDDARGFATAVVAGADRIEISSALVAGGLSPSAGLMALAAKSAVPVTALIRPRAGDFVYNSAEVDVMLADIDAARGAGLSGVSLGAARPDRRLDAELLARLAARAEGMELTLNRVFDLVPDYAEAVETAVSLGFSRIHTSGGAEEAQHALDNLRRIIALADGRIAIMPSAAARIDAAITLIEELGISELHSSGGSLPIALDAGLVQLGFDLPGRRHTDHDQIAALRAVINI